MVAVVVADRPAGRTPADERRVAVDGDETPLVVRAPREIGHTGSGLYPSWSLSRSHVQLGFSVSDFRSRSRAS
jgi:hypothetical protein